MAKANPRGRPSKYTPELADEICARIIKSDYGLEEVCSGDDLPHPATVYRWLAANADFRERYARAKEAQGHVQADRGMRDALTATDASIGRLRFDARKWAASKLAPKHYGDKVALTGGSADDEPLKAQLTVKFVRG